jgi:hypothetical protein
MTQASPGSEYIRSWNYYGESALDASNQMYFAVAPDLVVHSTLTGKSVAGPWTQNYPQTFVAMTNFQCIPVNTVNASSLPVFSANQARFAYPECIENRTWPQLSKEYKAKLTRFSTGGLGTLANEEFEVWTCFQGHPCLSRMQLPANADAMCYVFNEKEEKWYPWCLESEISSCPRIPGNTSRGTQP